MRASAYFKRAQWLAALAFLCSVLASPYCCANNSAGPDAAGGSVLGAMVICTAAGLRTLNPLDDGTGDEHTTAHCTQCVLAACFVLAAGLLLLGLLVWPVAGGVRLLPVSSGLRTTPPGYRLCCRGPPRLF